MFSFIIGNIFKEFFSKLVPKNFLVQIYISPSDFPFIEIQHFFAMIWFICIVIVHLKIEILIYG